MSFYFVVVFFLGSQWSCLTCEEFGSAWSVFFVPFRFSSSLFVSWPFLFALVFCLVVFLRHFSLILFALGVFFLSPFSAFLPGFRTPPFLFLCRKFWISAFRF
ncbi:unnamed protein product [Polarella glacialis]|uniref:Uncharacterized protein n=1 Tax=Polarella glacialis TaxID=89957 RepID=A0A813IY78_POLGL|nr:unnamed protein product [Polarella glacialis]